MGGIKLNTEDYRFHDVVISPYLTPWNPGEVPSFIGNISINKQYTIHYKHNHFVSVNCGLSERPVDIDFTCIYAGLIIYSYGHALIESLANLYFIKQLSGDIPLVFTGNGLSFFHSHHRDLFELFNLKVKLSI